MRKCLLMVALLLGSLFSYGQGSLRELAETPKDEEGRYPFWRCATVEVQEALRSENPQHQSVEEFEAFMQKANALRKSKRAAASEDQIYYLPVVVHVIHQGEAVGSGSNISLAQIQSQIDVLNEDFRRMEGSRGFNDHPNGADTRIEFVLAMVDPNGNELEESGVHRVRDTDLGVSGTLDPNSMDNIVKPATSWDPNRYLNMWTANLGGGLLGYAQFPIGSGLDGLDLPGMETGAETDGVVMRYSTFGSTDKGNFPDMYPGYDKGRTTTHEVGHWLGLRHIWGDGGCGVDDYCTDTPGSDGPNYSCPTGTVSCGTVDMIENYMDYSGDECMNIFTVGQSERMFTVLEYSPRRNELLYSDVIFQQPGAEFTADRREVYQGQQVAFQDRSNGDIVSWSWEFEGGEPVTSAEQNPVITYNEPGIYQVGLTVADDTASYAEVKHSYIVVNETTSAPVASFGVERSNIFSGQAAQFIDYSDETVYSWNWEFEGGEPATSTEQNPLVSYAAAGTYNATLTVTNALGSDSRTIEGVVNVVDGPILSYSPGSFEENLNAGDSVLRTLTLTNEGEDTLFYSLGSVYAGASERKERIDFKGYMPAKGEKDTRLGHAVTQRSGTDGKLYSWIDSKSANGPAFNWIDISSTGTTLSLGDDHYQSVNLPFAFPFYEETKNTVYVGSNGFLSFNSASASSLSNTQLPNANTPNDLIAAYWTDLYPGSKVTYLASPEHFIVQFTDVPRYGGSGSLTFQYILYPSGEIKLQYLNMVDSYQDLTIGIEDATGAEGMEIAFNTAFVENNLAVLITTREVIEIGPYSEKIAPGASEDVGLTFNAKYLLGGTYENFLAISSNDPRNEYVEIPVTLHVAGSPVAEVNADTLDFGSIMVGASNTATFTIVNSGTDVLEVTHAIDNAFFVAEFDSLLTVPARGSAELSVAFHPTTVGAHTGNLTLATNDAANPEVVIALTGEATPAPSISVSPADIYSEVNMGDSVNHLLTVSNAGGAELNYSINLYRNVENMRMESQGAKLTSTDQTDDTPSVAQALSANAQNQLVLVIQETLAWGVDMQADVLTPMGINSHKIGTADIASTNFSDYGMVITVGDESTTYYNNLSANVAQFESYVNGGGVVIYQAATQGANVSLAGGAVVDYTGGETFNEVVDASHYIVQGLPTVLEGNNANHTTISNFPAGANVITVEQSSGRPTTVEYALGSGVVIATGMTWEWGYINNLDYGPMLVYTSDYGLNHAESGWLSVDAYTGVVAAGGTEEVTLKLNAKNLMGGTYNGLVRFVSNDPVQQELDVPVTFRVFGTPEITVSEAALNYEPTFIGDSISQLITITNAGTDLLLLDTLFTPANFSVYPASFELAIGEAVDVLVSFVPEAAGDLSGSLTIESNDPANGSIAVALSGTGVNPPVMEVSAEGLIDSLRIGEASAVENISFSNTGSHSLTMQMYRGAYSFQSPQRVARERNVGFHASAAGMEVAKNLSAESTAEELDNERILEEHSNFIRGNVGMSWVNGDLYVLQYPSGSVYKYDVENRVAHKQFDAPANSYGLAWDGEYIWVGNGSVVTGYDLHGRVVGNFDVPNPGSGYNALAFDAASATFLTTDAFGQNTLYRVTETGAEVNFYVLPAGYSMNQLTVNNGTLWALDVSNSGSIYDFTLSSNNVVVENTYSYPFPIQGYSLALDAEGDLWAADWYTLYKMNPRSMNLPAWISADISAAEIEVAEGGSYAFDVNFHALEGMPVGKHTMELLVESDDPQNRYVMVPFVLNVENSVPHKKTTVPNQTLILDEETYQVEVTALFADVNLEDELQYEVTADNDNVELALEEDLLTVSTLRGGDAHLTIYANDTYGGRSEGVTFTVTVVDPNNNAPAESQTLAAQELHMEDSVQYNLYDYFSDADGDDLTFEVETRGEAVGVQMRGTVLQINGLSIGRDTVDIMVSDNRGGTFERALPVDVLEPLAVNDQLLTGKVLTYPNPFADEVKLKLEGVKPGAYSLLVFDLQGRKVKAERWEQISSESEKVVDLNLLPQGTYLVKIVNAEGSTVHRIVKQ